MTRNIFDKRINIKPYEYPELLEFKDAIRHSYWLHTEFNFTGDIQDYRININDQERSVLTRTMLAISQIEVSVKRFWGDLYRYFPKPEIDDVGGTFAECHIEGTEFLTESGWKKFDDIQPNERVSQYNPNTNQCEFVLPISRTKKMYNGSTFDVNGAKVTPNHRVIFWDQLGQLQEALACELKTQTVLVPEYHETHCGRVTAFIKENEDIYNGYVYCFTVPSGILVSRLNGKVTISGNSEVRHKDAYSFLLEKLGLNEMFSDIKNIPPLMKRIEYMERFMRHKDVDNKQFVLSLVLFSLFIEHISLFGQFFTIMSFNKHKNLFKGISNAIEATSKEEEIHGRFGIALYNILKEDHPELFTQEFYQDLTLLANEAFTAEKEILDWIFEAGDLTFISKALAQQYIMNRYNKSFEELGLPPAHNIDPEMLKQTEWFDIEILSTKETDFFNKRSTDYSKKMKQVTADDLF